MTTEYKNWDRLGLSNDFLFSKVMRNPRLCKKMLELILDIRIDHIEYPEPQKSIDEEKDARSIRLDIYVKDDKNTVYNCEVQTSDTRELPKRSRYYQSMLDVQELNKGTFYSNLSRSYVIFICTFDLFGQGRHKYTFENRCREDAELVMGDEAVKLFLNTEGIRDDVSASLKAFLDYMGGRDAEGEYIEQLKQEVAKAKSNREWRREYMTLYMRDQENIRKGKAEGEATLRKLMQKLLEEKRYDDLQRICVDREYCEQLYEQYGINYSD